MHEEKVDSPLSIGKILNDEPSEWQLEKYKSKAKEYFSIETIPMEKIWPIFPKNNYLSIMKIN